MLSPVDFELVKKLAESVKNIELAASNSGDVSDLEPVLQKLVDAVDRDPDPYLGEIAEALRHRSHGGNVAEALFYVGDQIGRLVQILGKYNEAPKYSPLLEQIAKEKAEEDARYERKRE
jgi:hypothetical protein